MWPTFTYKHILNWILKLNWMSDNNVYVGTLVRLFTLLTWDCIISHSGNIWHEYSHDYWHQTTLFCYVNLYIMISANLASTTYHHYSMNNFFLLKSNINLKIRLKNGNI